MFFNLLYEHLLNGYKLDKASTNFFVEKYVFQKRKARVIYVSRPVETWEEKDVRVDNFFISLNSLESRLNQFVYTICNINLWISKELLIAFGIFEVEWMGSVLILALNLLLNNGNITGSK